MDALSHLHDEHAAAVRAYVARRSDAQTADDVCAEVWAVVWRRLSDVPDDALPWLFGVARRVLANERRRQRRQLALRERLTAPRDAQPVDASTLRDDPILADALRRLRPADVEVLLLTAWEELPPERAAAALGIRAGTFAVRLHRARKRLADAIAAVDAESAAQGRPCPSAATPIPEAPK